MCCGTSCTPSHDLFLCAFQCLVDRFLGSRAKDSPLKHEWVEFAIRASVGNIIDVIQYCIVALYLCVDYLKLEIYQLVLFIVYAIGWFLLWAVLIWNARMKFKEQESGIKCCNISVYCWKIIFKLTSITNAVIILSGGLTSRCFTEERGVALIILMIVITVCDILFGIIYIFMQLFCIGFRSFCPDKEKERINKRTEKV